MDKCYRCEREADFECPECGSRICRYHMEFIYTGLDRGFGSRFMCPVCWLVKRKVPDERMIKLQKAKEDEPSMMSRWDAAFTPQVKKRKSNE